MKSNLWIINHHANESYLRKGYRHYWFSKELIQRGYKVTVFCASFVHKGTDNITESGKAFVVRKLDGIRYIFIKVSPYEGNGYGRIKAMFEFANGVSRIAKRVASKTGIPDVILGSSVHPLACYEAIKFARKFKCKSIVEIRDLWPESILMTGVLKDDSPITKAMFIGEKWLYKNCDQLIFTFEGGYQYIKDKGWDKEIPEKKVHSINNGIDLKMFDLQSQTEVMDDIDLESGSFKVVYTGTIAFANGMDVLIDAAKKLRNEDILFLLYGDGEKREELENYCRDTGLKNVRFKGRIDKKYIPYVLCHADCYVVCGDKKSFEGKHSVLRYGGSQNKVPEYLAGGHPIIYSIEYAYSIIKKYSCGLELNGVLPASMAEAIMMIKNMNKDDYKIMCRNARKAANDYEISYLVDRLEVVINEAMSSRKD